MYTDEEMEEIEADPVRLKAYFWRMSKHWTRLAATYREEARKVSFDEGLEKIRWAKTLDTTAGVLLENLDAFVESTVRKPTAPRTL